MQSVYTRFTSATPHGDITVNNTGILANRNCSAPYRAGMAVPATYASTLLQRCTSYQSLPMNMRHVQLSTRNLAWLSRAR